MQNQQDNGPGDKLTMKQAADWLYVLTTGHAACFWPFLRRDFGISAFGGAGLAAFAVIMIFIMFTGADELMWFLGLWVALVCFHRGKALKAEKGGEVRHSRYSGDPLMKRWLPFIKRDSTAKRMEATIVFIAGVLFLPASEGVGLFMIVGAASMLVSRAIEEEMHRVRMRRMRDAMIDQSWHVARYKGETDEF